jgi:hypothetical protein
MDMSTGEFRAVVERRYENLDAGWVLNLLNELNKSVKWIRQHLSGNARMCVPWSGGQPGRTVWEAPVNPLGEPKPKRKQRT